MSCRILYVDDEADIREIAEMALELDPQFSVRSCGSGRDGIAQARDWQPDLILLDVMMPELDGSAVLGQLRADPATEAIPVVFITARTQAHEVAHLRALGARGVIAKPFDPMLLVRQVRDFLDG
ncbi:response regulator [Sphingopyxis sp. YF1]|uniref:response regulator n=1 Tax=Sphingopyxis sp. YF1 TaxID=2482763 RepID=UPI001F6096B9|nr:response regulator [Sphingopyxis sp. YF1]UNU42811.1 response regulator [Sphingopyxis sp. YF1]